MKFRKIVYNLTQRSFHAKLYSGISSRLLPSNYSKNRGNSELKGN